MARNRKGLPIDGMLLLDKPHGISSNRALQQLKFLMNAQKAGHTGSLDPIATGLLPLCFGHCTKISNMFLDSDKRYTVKIKLGETTDSGDSEGEILSTRDIMFTDSDLEQALKSFVGKLKQIPPMYSALKRNGQPLYKLARQGIEVKREPRDVRVFELNQLNRTTDTLELDVWCSKGFYVRSLAMDLGETLGCGGHVVELRRTAVGNFTIDQAKTIEQVEEIEQLDERHNLLIATDQALLHLPKIDLDKESTENICYGRPIRGVNLPNTGLARLYSDQNKFLGLGEISDQGTIAPKRLFI